MPFHLEWLRGALALTTCFLTYLLRPRAACALLCFALLCIALHCIALLCIALLCFALLCFCFALLCFALQGNLWHQQLEGVSKDTVLALNLKMPSEIGVLMEIALRCLSTIVQINE